MAQRRRLTTEQRFLSHVLLMPDGCWHWTATVDKDGYGTFWNGEYRAGGNRRPINVRAHRWSYERHVGPVREGFNLCHTCDFAGCVNPDHLFVGTQRDNIQDCIAKGRFYTGRAILTIDQIAEIRASYTGSRGEVTALSVQYGVKRSVVDYALFKRAPHRRPTRS